MSHEEISPAVKHYFDQLLKKIVQEQQKPSDTVILELRLTYDEAIAITQYLANLRGHTLEGKKQEDVAPPSDVNEK